MLKPILSTAKNILTTIFALLFAALIGILAWGSNELYKNERTNRRFVEEGRLVTVQVTYVDRHKRAWYDQFSNAAYVSFNYQGKRNEVRYKQDSGWISVGESLNVWYHPGLNAFRYPDKTVTFNNKLNRSRLIDFTILNRWTNERKWLLFTLVFTALFFVLLFSALHNIIGLPLLKWPARLLIMGMILCTLSYLVYNTWQYYRYYSKVKSNSSQITATVLDTDRMSDGQKSHLVYHYFATVTYPKGKKTIPISEEDYDRLKPNDHLQVLYNAGLDDLMSVNYSPDHTNLYGCIFLVALGIYFVWRYFIKGDGARQTRQDRTG